MKILQVNLQIGSKCYLRYDGAIREAIFDGTKSAKKPNHNYYALYYMLNIAGVGNTLVEFDDDGQFDNWYRCTTCRTILFHTIEDCLNNKSQITALCGSVSNAYNGRFMQQFFPDFRVCCCGGTIHAYAWDGTQPVYLGAKLPDFAWVMDKKGFRVLEEYTIQWWVQGTNYWLYRVNPTKTYITKEECMADNRAVVVTF